MNGDTSARLTMLLVAITTNQRDRLEAIADLPVPATGENTAFIYLCNTLLYAALDSPTAARQIWQTYKHELGATRSNSDLLGEFLVADLVRRHVESYLAERHILD